MKASGLDSDSTLDVTTLSDIELSVRMTRAWDANQTHDYLIYRAENDRRHPRPYFVAFPLTHP